MQNERLGVLIGDGREGAIEVFSTGELDRLELQVVGTGRGLDLLVVKQSSTNVRIPDQRKAGNPGDSFAQQLQPLPAEFGRDIAEPSDIPAGAREAGDEPSPDGIDTVRHHDRDRLSLSFDRRRRRIVARYDHVRFEATQLSRELWKSFGSGLTVTNCQSDRCPLDIAQLPQ